MGFAPRGVQASRRPAYTRGKGKIRADTILPALQKLQDELRRPAEKAEEEEEGAGEGEKYEEVEVEGETAIREGFTVPMPTTHRFHYSKVNQQ